MKTLSFILNLVIFIFLPHQLIAQSQIEWSADVKLKWDDFQAEADTNVYGFALTAYKIEILPKNVQVDQRNNIVGFQKLTTKAYFLKNESWVYKKDDFLLTHEQLHFDIAALHSNKMNKQFTALKKKKIANYDEYWKVYEEVWQDCLAMQREYDRATKHGQNREANKLWFKKIEQLLNEYK
ncbi:MAG: DUF922 domain-containing protein [Flavobacteriaceae bacterium]|nr:DUF922 domain-containing protein [Flavobacteriaceae bacterium]